MKFPRPCKRMTRWWTDEGGMEALQTVCIIAISAVVMVGAAKIGKKGVDFAEDKTEIVTEESDSSLKERLKDRVKEELDNVIDEGADAIEEGLEDLADELPF